jgi:hypothetical protein
MTILCLCACQTFPGPPLLLYTGNVSTGLRMISLQLFTLPSQNKLATYFQLNFEHLKGKLVRLGLMFYLN